MSSQSSSETLYDLGELVEEHPVDLRGMAFLSLFLAIGSLALLAAGLYLYSSDTMPVGRRLFTSPAAIGLGAVFAAILILGYVIPLTQMIRTTRSLRTLLNPPPDFHSTKGSLLAFPVIAVLAVMLFFNMGIAVAILAGVGLLAALGVLVHMLRNRGQSLRICERGLILPIKNKSVAVRWEDINAVWVRGSDGHIGCYDGTYLPIESLWRSSGQALAYINKTVSERLGPEMLKDYEAGELVSFGRFGVSKQGLTFGQSVTPWQRINSIEVSASGVSIIQGNGTRRLAGVSAHDIPNLVIFLTLTSQILSPTKAATVSPQEEPSKPLVVQGEERMREFRPSVRGLISPAVWLTMGMGIMALDWANQYANPSFRITYFGAAILLIGVYQVAAWLHSLGVRVQATSDTLTYRRFGKTQTLEWSDFSEIRRYWIALGPIELVHRYKLSTSDERTLNLRQGLWHLGLLGDYVEKQVYTLLVPRAEELISRGQIVSFAQWGVSQQGIHDRNRVLPRDDISQILVKQRVIIVWKKGQSTPWTRIPRMGTPNLGVLLVVAKAPVKLLFPAFRAS